MIKLLTGATQAENRPNRSTRDVLSIIDRCKTKKNILNRLHRPLKSHRQRGRENTTDYTFRKGMPRRCIGALPQGRSGAQLRSKIDGELGDSINKGGLRGIPLSAHIFAIRFGAILSDYDNSLPEEIKQAQSETIGRNEFASRKRPIHLCEMTNREKT